MKQYWNNLKDHPGVNVVITLQILALVSGLTDCYFNIYRILITVGIISLFWIPVLITNYTNNKNQV